MTDHELRMAVVAEAAAWIGTPYAYGCMQRGHGVDCARFAARAYQASGLLPERIELPIAGRDRLLAGKAVDRDLFRRFILKWAYAIKFDDRLPADLITFAFCGVESHVGIVDVDIDFMIDAPSRSKVRRRKISKISSVVGVYRHNLFAKESNGN